MSTFIEQAKDYAAYHQNKIAHYTHMIGAPLLMFSFMILLGFIHVVIVDVLNINLANIVTLILLIYYFRLHWLLALAITPILILMLWVATFFNHAGPTSFGLWAFVLIFLTSIVLLFTGHLLEEKRPAYDDTICQMFISPLVSVAELFFAFGQLSTLRESIYGKESKHRK